MEHSTAYSSMRFWISREALRAWRSTSARAASIMPMVRYTSDFAGVDAAAHSASFSWIRPNSAIDLPNAFRSLAYWMPSCKRVARAADAGSAQFEAADVQDVERDVVTLADLAEQVFGRHLAVRQDQRAGGGAADAELVLLRADREARRIALDEERGELLAVDLGEDREEVGEAALVIHIFSPLRM